MSPNIIVARMFFPTTSQMGSWMGSFSERITLFAIFGERAAGRCGWTRQSGSGTTTGTIITRAILANGSGAFMQSDGDATAAVFGGGVLLICLVSVSICLWGVFG